MKISYNWLQSYFEKPLPVPEKLADIFAMHFAEVEEIIYQGKGLEKVVVGEVLEKVKHPNADRLNLVKINVGEKLAPLGGGDGGILEIVCGAANIDVGQKVPVALIGANLPGDFKIEKREVRGIVSNGMVCSEKELGLAKESEGIFVLDKKAKIGMFIVKALGLDDAIIDLKVLPDRAHDCLSHWGVAKELAAILKSKIKNQKSKLQFKIQKSGKKLDIKILEPNLCSRYLGRIIENVKVGQSPTWMKKRIEVIGQKSINNIVDATNFVMFEMGQPSHAFDWDKIVSSKQKVLGSKEEIKQIIVRKAKVGEKIETLDGQVRELDENILVIADADGPIAIAGVMGGKRTAVDENTKNIIIEAANFDSVSVRKTSRKLGLRTDASVRFENGVSSEMAELGMDRVTDIVAEVGVEKGQAIKIGGKEEFYPRRSSKYVVGLHPRDVENLLGIKIEEKEIVEILTRLGFEIKKVSPVKNIVKLAKELVGVPYKYGASVLFDAPEFFDCSSFASYVFANSGIQIPRISVDQYLFGEAVADKEAKVGDLVFFNEDKTKAYKAGIEFAVGSKVSGGISHVGIYLGGGKVAHAAKKNGKVAIEDLKKISKIKNFQGFRRVVHEADDLLVVRVSFERLDVKRKEDLIEEVGRIYGYENIPSKMPAGILTPPARNDNFFYGGMIKNIMVGLGYSEIYNYSFANKGEIELQNPIASDKKFMRTNLLDGLRTKAVENTKNGHKNACVFEIGKIFPLVGETSSFAAVIHNGEFYETKGVVETVFEKLGITDLYFQDIEAGTGSNEHQHWCRIADIRVGNTSIGFIDKDGFEINFEMLVKMANEEMEYRPISKYPAADRDIALFVPIDTRMAVVEDIIENAAGQLLVDSDLFDIYEQEETGRKSLAFRLVFQSSEKTLSDSEIAEAMQKIYTAIGGNPEWEVRK